MSKRLRFRPGWVGGISLAVVVIAGGCSLLGAKSALYLFPWHYDFVLSVRGHAYHVTQRTVSRVGPEVTEVAYHGVYSGWYKVYSVPGVPVSQEVAVHARQGYLEAVRVPGPQR